MAKYYVLGLPDNCTNLALWIKGYENKEVSTHAHETSQKHSEAKTSICFDLLFTCVKMKSKNKLQAIVLHL